MPLVQFFKVMGGRISPRVTSSIPHFLQNRQTLRSTLRQIAPYTHGNYLHDNFTHWVSAYVHDSAEFLQGYFADKYNLDNVCKDFIGYCFKQHISLDKSKTLESFEYHDEISDRAVKSELIKIKPKERVNLLGFGLGDGYYEKSLAQFLVSQGIAKTVSLYGFDPYAEKTEGVEFLTPSQLTASKTPVFDVITARWALHHVALQSRWPDFMNCINRCGVGAAVIIVEHGFLKEQPSQVDKKLYYLLNATFDIVANIGLRPHYFTSTSPDIGANFFIHYLLPEDFATIKSKVSLQFTQSIYDVGPGFPNQTICSMRAVK